MDSKNLSQEEMQFILDILTEKRMELQADLASGHGNFTDVLTAFNLVSQIIVKLTV